MGGDDEEEGDEEGESDHNGPADDSDSDDAQDARTQTQRRRRNHGDDEGLDDDGADLDDFIADDNEGDDAIAEDLPSAFSEKKSLADSFEIFAEYLLYSQMDEKFQADAERSSKDRAYYANRHAIERKLCAMAEELGGGGHWDGATRKCLESWSKFRSQGDGHHARGQQCQLCDSARAETLHDICLYGKHYDDAKFWETGQLELLERRVKDRSSDRAVNLVVGKSCLGKASLFHQLHHFKLHLYEELENRAEKEIELDRTLRESSNFLRLRNVVLDRTWLRLRFQQLENLMDTAQNIVLR